MKCRFKVRAPSSLVHFVFNGQCWAQDIAANDDRPTVFVAAVAYANESGGISALPLRRGLFLVLNTPPSRLFPAVDDDDDEVLLRNWSMILVRRLSRFRSDSPKSL